MRLILLTLGLVAIAELAATEVHGQGAQPPFSNLPPSRPVVSPYLQLLNQQTPGVSNYFTLVKPQIEARRELVQQQYQIDRLAHQVNRQRPAGLPVQGSKEIRGTGHETVYMNYLHYYPIRRQ
jgi:hypothetical protein